MHACILHACGGPQAPQTPRATGPPPLRRPVPPAFPPCSPPCGSAGYSPAPPPGPPAPPLRPLRGLRVGAGRVRGGRAAGGTGPAPGLPRAGGSLPWRILLQPPSSAMGANPLTPIARQQGGDPTPNPDRTVKAPSGSPHVVAIECPRTGR